MSYYLSRTGSDRPDVRKRTEITSTALTPAVGDRQPSVAAECLKADLGARRVLPPLVLGKINQPDDPVAHMGMEPHLHNVLMAGVALDVIVKNVVEQLVRRQRVGVL